MKRYLNRDFTIYRVIAKEYNDWTHVTNFNFHMWDKFCGLTDEEAREIYGWINHDAKIMHVTKETGMMYGSYGGDSQWYIIPNDSTEILDYFMKHAPMEYMKKYKRVIGLQTYCEHRDWMIEDFEKYVEHQYSTEYKQRRDRENKLTELLND